MKYSLANYLRNNFMDHGCNGEKYLESPFLWHFQCAPKKDFWDILSDSWGHFRSGGGVSKMAFF